MICKEVGQESRYESSKKESKKVRQESYQEGK